MPAKSPALSPPSEAMTELAKPGRARGPVPGKPKQKPVSISGRSRKGRCREDGDGKAKMIALNTQPWIALAGALLGSGWTPRQSAAGKPAAERFQGQAWLQNVVYFGAVQPPQAHGHDQSATRPLFAST